ncbi:LysR family transcriptional regulator [Haloferula sargassicola]|uniref:Hydrogen peroxide-inducible genes activator n=1 Tax=Haloferula sargassicola TaxID=490096 RepID=A0ABP9UHZ1_9BACT
MDLRQLRSFVSVVEEGSLSAASKRCHLSQPALSQQMQALEEQLGEPLLRRLPRGVEPTAAGELLISHARTLLAQAEQLRQDFQGRRELETGRLAFGIIPTVAPYLLPRLLAPFRREHPGITIAIDEARTPALLPKTVAGEIEFAILSDVTAEERRKWSLNLRELFREPLLLAAPASHPLALRKNPPEPAEIDPAELIHLSGGHCLADRALKLCRIRNPNPGLQCDQIGTALAMTAAGMGVTIVPKLAAGDHARPDLVFRPFAGDGLHRSINLLKRRGAKLSPAAVRLMDALRAGPA